LDEIDLKILVELQEDSRITKTRLAKKYTCRSASAMKA